MTVNTQYPQPKICIDCLAYKKLECPDQGYCDIHDCYKSGKSLCCNVMDYIPALNDSDVLRELELLLMYLRTHPEETCQDIRDYIDLRMGQLREQGEQE
jgi:hypothetical protein